MVHVAINMMVSLVLYFDILLLQTFVYVFLLLWDVSWRWLLLDYFLSKFKAVFLSACHILRISEMDIRVIRLDRHFYISVLQEVDLSEL